MKLNGFVLFQIMVFDFDKVLSSFDVIVSLPAQLQMVECAMVIKCAR